MEDHIFSHFNAILLIISLAFFSIFIWKTKSFKLSKPHNPFPPEISGGWPVIGHLLEFSGNDDIPLSRKLAFLADKYGPVFTFRLGLPRILVVSSYDAVKDCLNTNDKVFSDRPSSLAGEYIGYNNAMLFLASYGVYWRNIRKIVIKEVLSSSRLDKLKYVRVSEVQMSIKELFSLFFVAGDNFPVTGGNVQFPGSGDQLPITGDQLPVTGDNVDLLVTGDQLMVTRDQLLVIGDQSPVTGDNVQFPGTGDHLLVTGDQLPVIGENVDFTVTGDQWPVRDQLQVTEDNIDFPVTGDQLPVTRDQMTVTGDQLPITGDNVNFPVTGDNISVKVNLTDWIEKLTLSLIVKMIAGKSYGRLENEEEAERFKRALKDFMYISMEFVLWDAFPIALFKWIDFQGHVKFMKRTFKDIDCVLQNWLDEHVKKRVSVDVVAGNEHDFIDVMLSMMNHDDFSDGYTRETTIKATVLSMVLDASDTTAIHLNWVMATLLNHRDVMKKVQEELDTKVGRNRWVEESDIKNLVYFQAVVKETLRLYPPAPLLVPHESVEDCIVQGYHIPKGTRLWVNTMKLQRDPKIWSNPDMFDPERFLTSQVGVDVRGQQYEFIPFGSGRRSCPGITYATQVTHLAIAHLFQGFDFSTPSNEPLDMKQGLGMTMRKVNPIEVFITPRLPSVLYKF
ncbi:hypothetical protein K7X08_014081 [Anisodus acutangulus]|uniref:Cytochrome P450 n=1 Tax=Anisodus acutangulus TaxID=402998 RepID=A0A9Q1R4G9_9SOLA|nr:hypothetical protein K7X08_014081 [Anisodus acutangulus]